MKWLLLISICLAALSARAEEVMVPGMFHGLPLLAIRGGANASFSEDERKEFLQIKANSLCKYFQFTGAKLYTTRVVKNQEAMMMILENGDLTAKKIDDDVSPGPTAFFAFLGTPIPVYYRNFAFDSLICEK